MPAPTKSGFQLRKGVLIRMNKIAFVKPVVVAEAFLILCAAPKPAFAQSSQPGAAPPPLLRSAAAPPRNPTAPPELLEGLTLTDDQQAKIGQIRDDTRSRIAAVTAAANDKKLSPEAANAMLQGLQRIENGKILEVLTPEQQQEVRTRLSAWRASVGQRPRQFKQPRALEKAPQPNQDGPTRVETQNPTATSNQK
jgi:Spy/CpxP family protein refolding chaperone